MGVDKKLDSRHQGMREARSVTGNLKAIGTVVAELSRATDDWIPVTEQLPLRSADYLVLMRGRRCRIMTYAPQSATFVPRGLNPAVTHWRALPPLPA